MSTNYGRGDGPDSGDRTAASTSKGNPAEPGSNSHPTEPIRGDNPTEPIHGTNPTRPIHGPNPTEPISGANATKPISGANATKPIRGMNATGLDDHAASSDWHRTTFPESRDNNSGSNGANPNDPARPARPRRRPRAGTIVWGLIVMALAVVLILAEVPTLNLDMGQVIITLLIGAGLALVIGGVISAGNREKDDKHP